LTPARGSAARLLVNHPTFASRRVYVNAESFANGLLFERQTDSMEHIQGKTEAKKVGLIAVEDG